MTANQSVQPASMPPLSHDQRLWRWRILIATYSAYVGYYLTRKVFTICKTTLSAEFGVGIDQIAHIWTVYLVAYMVGQFVNSFLGRKYGSRALLLVGLGGSILVNVYFGLSNSYWTFMVFMGVNGLFQASGWPGSVGGVAQWLRPQERGKVMGVWSTNYLVGDILVKSIGAFLLGHLGWRYAFFGCTILAVFAWLIVYFWQRNKPEDVGLNPIIDHESSELRAVSASSKEHITFREYLPLLLNPVVPLMGLSYLFVKFLRYSLDSWLPTFLDLQGMGKAEASYYSNIFTIAGLAGALFAGWALDRWFRGNWAALCSVMGCGMILGYVIVVFYGGSPVTQAIIFGLVGFMMFGPDTILAGAASVTVAGERNGVALAGLVNGIASIGPIIQEEVIGWFMRTDPSLPEEAQQLAAIQNANQMGLVLSIAFVVLMAVLIWRVAAAHKKHAV